MGRPKTNAALQAVQHTIEKYSRDTDHPFAPVLQASNEIALNLSNSHAKKRQKNFNTLQEGMRQATEQSLHGRAERLVDYIGPMNKEINLDKIKETIEALVFDKEGNKVSAAEYQTKIFHIIGKVFTGHPVYNMNPELAQAFSNYFNHRAGNKKFGPETESALKEAICDFVTPTIDSEANQAINAIENYHDVIGQVEELAIQVARKHYPEDWKNIDYMPMTVATWIPFDWDGRTDIDWNKLMEVRIKLQIKMLERHDRSLKEIQDILSNKSDRACIQKLRDKIVNTLVFLKGHEHFCATYCKENDPELKQLEAWQKKFYRDTKERITHPRALINSLQIILDKTTDDDVAAKLVYLRSRLKNHGITLAQTHFRINANTAIKVLDEVSAQANEVEIEGLHLPSIKNKLHHFRPEDKFSNEETDFLSLVDTKTLMKQLGLIKQITRGLDSHSCARFLIAETHGPLAPFLVLYYAKKFGIDKNIEISHLCEDRLGQDQQERIARELFHNRVFLDHYFGERPDRLLPVLMACFEYGLSDASRFDGVTSASAFAEKAQGEVMKALLAAKKDKKTEKLVQLAICDFITHGSSLGRNTNFISYQHKLRQDFPGRLINFSMETGICRKVEESPQGGDGNLFFLDEATILAITAQELQYLTQNHDVGDDPYYNERRNSVLVFFQMARMMHDQLRCDSNYAFLIDHFKSFLPKTGSRPVKRAKTSGGDRELPRAIPHVGTLQQVGVLSNVIHGISSAIRMNPTEFGSLIKNSPEFRLRMESALYAMHISCTETLKSYVEIYNPGFWQHKAKIAKDLEQRRQFREVAKQMRELKHEGKIYYDIFSTAVEEITDDFESLKELCAQYNGDLDITKIAVVQKAKDHFEKIAAPVHAMRLAALQDIFIHAVQIPEFSKERHEMGRQEAIRRAITGDRVIVDELRKIFPAAKTKRRARRTADYTDLHRDVFDRLGADFEIIIDASFPIMHCNSAVG